MENPKVRRQSGVELLRLLALVGVVMIHYCDIALPILNNSDSQANHLMLNFFRTLSSCAVDVFFVISGYFMCNSYKRSFGKPLSLILQVSLFNEMAYLVEAACGVWPLSARSIISSAIPDCYYTTLFVVLYFISPYINKFVDSLSQKELNRFVGIIFLIFSVFSIPNSILCELTGMNWMGLNTIGAWGSQSGFNIVNFALCYVLGGWLRKSEYIDTYKNGKLLVVILLCNILIFIGSLLNEQFNMSFGMRSAWCYDNPLVIVYSVSVFCIFLRFKFYRAIINKLSKAVYATFLIHSCLIKYFLVDKVCVMSPHIVVAHFIAIYVGMLLISYLCMTIYNRVFGKLIEICDRKKVLYYYE